jgi:uncharacterized membrane protein
MFVGSAFTDVLPATLVLIVITLIGGFIIFAVRKRMKSNFRGSTTFTLSQLKELREKGLISEEEYERARQSIINQS